MVTSQQRPINGTYDIALQHPYAGAGQGVHRAELGGENGHQSTSIRSTVNIYSERTLYTLTLVGDSSKSPSSISFSISGFTGLFTNYEMILVHTFL